ncbi:MAG: T9SS type A sorting domain-containing protein [Fidelibacterota bacterium]|nr:MAG: T9SS type A sorting domain-containing protein [Candidatus Neomarinimicrobiota bacterium]
MAFIGLSLGTLTGTEYLVSTPEEIESVLPGVQPGDTLTMTNKVWMDAEIIFRADGTEEQPILLRSQTPGQVVLSGTSYLKIAGEYLVVDGLYFKEGNTNQKAVIEFRDGAGTYAHHSRLTNTAIVNYYVTPEYKWISIYGTHNRVDHCYLRGKTTNGTTLVVWLDYNGGQPNYHLIDHNYFAYRPPLGENGGETIRVGTSDYSLTDSYTTVEYNYFERCNGEVEIISSKSCFNVYRYNTFYECEGALTLRHGNDCTVEGNFFIGNNKSMTGGVRIIGERHKVYNNYFQDLAGTGNRAAISLMDGNVTNTTDSLNQYFQVKDPLVAFNTLVNCSQSIILGLGYGDRGRTLPPLRPVFANNVVFSDLGYYLITVEDSPQDPLWEGNIMYGSPLGITPPSGIDQSDPSLSLSEDKLWRPSMESILIDSAVGAYPLVTSDMDGQPRDTLKDIGADERSAEPITRRPLTPEDVGPDWWPLLPTIIAVGAGLDSLRYAVDQAQAGDIIELVTAGGIYANTADLLITIPLTIRAAEGLEERPIIRQTEPAAAARSLFVINDGGRLTLSGVDLDGMAGSATPAKYLIRTVDSAMTGSYTLRVEDCYLHDVVLGDDGNFFRAYAGTYADSLVFRNCLFTNSGKEGIRLKDEASDSGNFNAGYLELTNSTFWLTRKEAVYVYAGDDIAFTPGPVIRVNHCTFDSCAYEGSAVIAALEVDDTIIRNSIFSNTPMEYPAVTLYGFMASIDYSNLFRTGVVVTERNASVGSNILTLDPLYADRLAGDFTLAELSPLRGQGDDGKAMGDLRWSGEVLSVPGAPGPALPGSFTLHQNYPNPFNAATRLTFELSTAAQVRLEIFNLLGEHLQTLDSQRLSAGRYVYHWEPQGLGSGIYLCRLAVNGRADIIRMLYLK